MKPRKNLRSLLRRQFAASRGASVLLIVIIFVACTLLAAWPRAVSHMFTDDVQETMSDVPATLRDLLTVQRAMPVLGPSEDPADTELAAEDQPLWGAMSDSMDTLNASVPAPLRSVLGEGHYSVGFESTPVLLSEPIPRLLGLTLGVNFDPNLDPYVDVVEGRKPELLTKHLINYGQSSTERSGETLEIMMSRTNAERSYWEVGDVRPVQLGRAAVESVEAELVGIFEPKNADDAFWDLNRQNLYPVVTASKTGDGFQVEANAYAAPPGFEFALPLATGVETRMWFPLDPQALNSHNTVEVTRQLTAFTGAVQEFTPPAPGSVGFNPVIDTVKFASESPQSLQESISRAATTNQILAMMAAGPLGVCLAALALASRMMLDRRRPTLVLAAARGASRGQLHGSMALEGLLLGLPAAATGVALALLAFPGPVTPLTWVPPLLLGLVPAALLGLSPVNGSLRGTRADLNPKARGKIRLAVEGSVLAMAAVSVVLLFQRGLGTADDGVSIDLLLAATPLLLALATCVVVLRLYPLPLAAIAKAQRSRTTLVSFLGPLRSLRAPGGGLVPVLSIVVGLAVVVFSGVMLDTLRSGVHTAAEKEIGADLRVAGPPFSPEQRGQIAQLDGVQTSVGVTTRSGSEFLLGEGDENDERALVRVIVADLDRLAEVQDGVPGSVPAEALEKAARPAGATLPIILSSTLAGSVGDTGTLEMIQGIPATIVATADGTMNLSVSDRWILVDESSLQEVTGYEAEPDTVLATLAGNADAAAITHELEALGADVEATTVQDEAGQISSAPLAGGLQAGLLVSMLFIGGLCALIVVMTSVVSAPARNKLVGLLRTLGFPKKHDSSLLLWEIGPVAAAGVLAGVVLGLLLPQLVVSGVDLRTFTGGAVQPPVAYDPLLLMLLVGGFIMVVLLAVAAAISAGRRQRLSSVIRIGEEV